MKKQITRQTLIEVIRLSIITARISRYQGDRNVAIRALNSIRYFRSKLAEYR